MATINHVQTPDGVIHDIGGGGGGSTTYTLTKSGSTITLTGSGGDVSSVTDANTTYSLSISGDTLTLTPSSGSAQSVTIPDDDTTYTISISGTTITLTPSSGTAQTVTIPDATTTSAGVMSASDKTKLDGIQSGAEVNVQADWNQSNSSADDYIKNKPSLATVATTGDYDDLTNKPTIPTVNDATLTIQKNGNTVETFTANSNTNKTANITVPTKTSELTNDSGFITTDEDTTYSLSETNGVVTLTGSDGSTSTVNTVTDVEVNGTSVVSGGVASVTVPTATSDLTNDSNFVSDASYVHTDNNFTNADVTKLNGIEAGAEVNVQSDWTQADSTADDYIKNKPTLATVATSGDYSDLSNKPTIPTVNDGTLTIQKNGSAVGTFTANQSGNSTANITVPTTTSELTNNSGFLTSESDPVFSASPASGITSSDITDWNDKQDELVSGTNIKTINGISLLGSGNISIALSDVFFATYGVTSYSDIVTALNDDKAVYVDMPNSYGSNNQYAYTWASANTLYFNRTHGDFNSPSIKVLSVDSSDNWTSETYNLVADSVFQSALYFQPGDTYVAVGRHAGLCTNASKDMQFSIVLPKSAKYCAGFTITNITGGVRITTGGYADNVGDGTSWSGRSGISFGGGLYNADGTNHANGDGKDAYMCTVNLSKTSAFKQNGTNTNVVNNTPVTLGGNISIRFT